jgi:hypothetical protein
MYKSVQKKSSFWTPASIQSKSKSLSKPGTFSVQPKSESKSSQQQEIPDYSSRAAEALAANVMRSLETPQQEQEEAHNVQRQIEPGAAFVVEGVKPTTPSPTPSIQSKEAGIQRQCSECAKEQLEESAEEGKDSNKMSLWASAIQTKLTVGAAGDKYEQEADRVAAQVMSMSVAPDSSPQVQRFGEESNPVQKWSLAQSITPVAQRQVDEQVQLREIVQRAFQPGGTQASGDLESRLNASKGGGSALAPEVRAFMEPRFGADFSSVRVHTGSESVQMNRELGAQAFAHGSDVYFGAGKSPENNELTAHELTHVVQQNGGAVMRSPFEKGQEEPKGEGITEPIQAKQAETPNKTGLSDNLKAGVENLSGYSLDDVRVHYNSSKPSQLQALAYTQGTEIHIAPGQEKHLPHEAWHVVQQKQARVTPTATTADGTALNTDSDLEREADEQGVQASKTASTEPTAPLRHVSLNQNSPIQGVFRFLTVLELLPEGPTMMGMQPLPPKRRWVWKDEETGAIYVWQAGMVQGPVDPKTQLPAYMLVQRNDGFSLPIKPIGNGETWEVAHDEDANPELKAFRLNTIRFERHVPVPRPTISESPNFEMSVTEETPLVHDATSFQQGSMGPSPRMQADQQLEAKDFRNARLESAFTVQVALAPLAQGTPHYDEDMELEGAQGKQEKKLRDYTYTAQQVGVFDISVGDTDRPNTYLEPKKGKSSIPQGKHTVAWAAGRRALMGLKGRSVDDLLAHFRASIERIIPLIGAEEANFLLKKINYPTVMELLAKANLPIDVWQSTLSQLIMVYKQVYQMSKGALFAGKSKQRGESPALKAFSAAEEALSNQQPSPHSANELKVYAANLLEITFSSPPQVYAFAVFHWVETLVDAFPLVMNKMGVDICKAKLAQKITATTYGIHKGKTVQQLLTFFSYPVPDFLAITAPPSLEVEEQITPFAFDDLQADFVANVVLSPMSFGVPMNSQVTQGTDVKTMSVQGYSLNELKIHQIYISDKDRPPTLFTSEGQKSHTVAWTLTREAMLSYANQELISLLTYLQGAFLKLEQQIDESKVGEHNNRFNGQIEGKQLVTHAQEQLEDVETKNWPIHIWQHYVSQLVKYYFHAYQVALTTAYADERTHGKALGHGEGAHMDTLRRNEEHLRNHNKLMNEPTQVVKAALALYDACIPQTPQVKANLEMRFMLAYDHWKEALQMAFPCLYQSGWSDLYNGLANVDVGLHMADKTDKSKDVQTGKNISHKMEVILKRNGRLK